MKKILALLVLITITNSAFASEPTLIDAHGDWESYTFTEESGRVCYMASTPKSSVGKYTYRGDIIAMLTHRPGDNSKNVFSFKTGYSFKANSEVTLKIDNKRWKLFTDKDTAWAKDERTDNEIAEAIQRGSKMTIEGHSSRGTYTKDTFSLRGTMSAYTDISRRCKVK
ncbi:MAG: invasion associated locus B family protein [Alphaproteobacteria bacterium]|nr:invasion associated locus B family protein [Alphaproteobacteria bacterium]